MRSNSQISFERILLAAKIHLNGFWLLVLLVLFDLCPVTTNSTKVNCEYDFAYCMEHLNYSGTNRGTMCKNRYKQNQISELREK